MFKSSILQHLPDGFLNYNTLIKKHKYKELVTRVLVRIYLKQSKYHG